MPEVTKEFLVDTVELATAAARMDKEAEEFKNAAPSTVDAMIAAGLVNPARRDEFVKKMAADPLCVHRTLRKVSGIVRPTSMGAGTETQQTKEEKAKRESDKFWERKYGHGV